MLCTQGRLKLNFICSDFREPCYMTRDSQFGFWTQMCSGIWTKREYLLLVGSIKVWPDWWSASYLNIQWVLNSFKDKQVYLNILIYNFILEKKKTQKNHKQKKKNPNKILLLNVFCKLFLLTKQEEYLFSPSVLTLIKIFCVFVWERTTF